MACCDEGVERCKIRIAYGKVKHSNSSCAICAGVYLEC